MVDRDSFKSTVIFIINNVINQALDEEILINKLNMIDMYCKLEILLYYNNITSFTEIACNAIKTIKYLNTNNELSLLHLTMITGLNHIVINPKISSITSLDDIKTWLKSFNIIYHYINNIYH